MNIKIGFIGAGEIATAICKGMLISARIQQDNKEVLEQSDLIILSVKPYQIESVLNEVRDCIDVKRHLFVSVAAGITIEDLENWTPDGCRIIRVMVNTASSILCAVAVACSGLHSTEVDMQTVSEIFSALGIFEIVSESMIMPMIGVCAPAYIFMAIEALADGAVKMGLNRKSSVKFAAQTCLGAAQMVLETGLHPGVLKDNVCSPGGTTIAAVHSLEKNGMRAAMMSAVEIAALKSQHLAKK